MARGPCMRPLGRMTAQWPHGYWGRRLCRPFVSYSRPHCASRSRCAACSTSSTSPIKQPTKRIRICQRATFGLYHLQLQKSPRWVVLFDNLLVPKAIRLVILSFTSCAKSPGEVDRTRCFIPSDSPLQTSLQHHWNLLSAVSAFDSIVGLRQCSCRH